MSCCTLIWSMTFTLIVWGTLAAALQDEPPSRKAPFSDRDDLQEAIAVLRGADRVETETVGEGEPNDSDVFHAYQQLRDQATRAQLEALLDDPVAVMRVFAFRALGERFPHLDPLSILWNHLQDEERIWIQDGCLIWQQAVADLMLGFIWKGLGQEQIDRLASYLITTPNQLDATERILLDHRLSPSLHSPVRRLAEGHNEKAVVALARYRRPRDLPLIRRLIEDGKIDRYWSLRTVASFPAPELFDYLVRLQPRMLASPHDSVALKVYYLALARYATDEAEALLEAPLDEGLDMALREPHIEALTDALGDAGGGECGEGSAIYHDAIAWRLWEEEHRVSAALIDRLVSQDPNRAVQASESSLRSLAQYAPPDDVLDRMLACTVRVRGEQAAPVLEEVFPRAPLNCRPNLARAMGEIAAESSIAPLMEALRDDANVYVRIATARALLAYGRSEVTDRVIASVARTTSGESGWQGRALRRAVEEVMGQPVFDR